MRKRAARISRRSGEPRKNRGADLDREAPRIVVVGSGWQFVSGISYYTWHLATALREHGHEVAVVLMRRLLPVRLYPGRERVGHNVTKLEYDNTMQVFDGVDWWAVPSLFRAIRFLREEHPDVIVLQWWTATVLHSYLGLVWAARALGSKVIVEFHEVLDSAELRLPLVGAYSRAMAAMVMRGVDGAVLHSEYDRQLLAEAYNISSLAIVVTPHGPYDHLLPETPSDDLARRDDPESPFRLLFFGTIRPYKGLENLLRAFELLEPAEAAQYQLTVIGETWEGWTLPSELIAASRYRDRIKFVNRYVDDDEAAAAFAEAEAVVLPYLRSSASGPLHMAMSHGLPVAVSDVGGLREAADGYEGALLLPPGDTDALLVALRRLRGMRGQRFEDPHSWSRTVRAIESLYTRIQAETAPGMSKA